jgi:hypothetical protein
MEFPSNIDRPQPKLTIEIQNKRPVELTDLTESLLSLGEEYKRFILSHPELDDTAGVKLYVKEIRSGSIVTELVALAAVGVPVVLPYIVNSNHLMAFAKHLKGAYDFFLDRDSNDTPVELQKQDYKLLSTFVEPVAKDRGSQINITAMDGGTVNITFSISSTEANAAQNVISKHIAELKEPEQRFYEKVLLYWYQARPDLERSVGDRAIIESVHPGPVKTIFDDEGLKAMTILSDPNPFRFAYIVDVVVETIKSKPALYKIIKVHDKEPLPFEDFS